MTILSNMLVVALLLFMNPAIAATAAADQSIPAKWVEHQLKFHYSGFTSKYSCDGIKSKVKLLLRQVGARDDVRVEGSCTGSYAEVQPFHNLRLAFAMPAPATAEDIATTTFPAKWEKVEVSSMRPGDIDAGDCELLEQLSTQVLTKLNARELDDKSRCTPYQRNLGSPKLTAMFLIQQAPEVLETAPVK